MASARKKFKPKKVQQFEPPEVYGAFAKAAFFDREITATRLHESRDNRGNVDLEYDDPNGNGGGSGK